MARICRCLPSDALLAASELVSAISGNGTVMVKQSVLRCMFVGVEGQSQSSTPALKATKFNANGSMVPAGPRQLQKAERNKRWGRRTVRLKAKQEQLQ